MKNNLLFSIILHIALLLPMTALGSQPTPNWYEKIYSYMPQDKKTYAGLIALGYLAYTLQKGLDFSPIDQSDVYAPSNMRNIAIFLSHVESDIFWRLFRIIAFNASGDWNAANEKLFEQNASFTCIDSNKFLTKCYTKSLTIIVACQPLNQYLSFVNHLNMTAN